MFRRLSVFLPPTSEKSKADIKASRTNKWVELRSSYYLFFPKEDRKNNLPFASLFHHDGELRSLEHPKFWRVCQANLYFCRHTCLFLVSLSQKLSSRGVLQILPMRKLRPGGGRALGETTQPVGAVGRMGLRWLGKEVSFPG